MEINKIYNENCLETMAKMPDGFIDLVVTSPPYDDLRTYNGYTFEFEPIAKELYRVIKTGGVLVWVVGDATKDGSESGTSFEQALYFKKTCGFNIHDTMIYNKGGQGGAKGSNYAYSQSFEYMFVFSKGKPKAINLIKDRKNTDIKIGISSMRKKNGETKEFYSNGFEYSKRTNVWDIKGGYMVGSPDIISFEHPAQFPEDLARDHIHTWSNAGDLVYDCFGGSGTTAKMAHILKRNWILSEISAEYVTIAQKRIWPYLSQQTMF